MLCPNCGQALSDHETICPGCGQALPQATASQTPDVEAAAAPAEASAEPAEHPLDAGASDNAATAEPTEASAENAAETEADSEEAAASTEGSSAESGEERPAEPKKKRSPLAIVLAAIIGLLLIVVVCLTITLTTVSKTGSMPNFVSSITDFFREKRFNEDAVAITVQNADGTVLAEITNNQLSYYFWGEYYYYVQSNGFGFDASKPLDQQNYSEDMTWQDFFLQNACTSIQQIVALKAAAQEAGFTLPEEYQQEYDTTISSMATYAQQAGFTDKDGNGDVLAYIRDSYGSAATEESFENYLYDSYYVTAYSDQIYADLSFTAEEVAAYYDENSEMFASYGIEKSELPNVNVRHILVEPVLPAADDTQDSAAEAASEEAAWADAEAEAQRILEEWKSGDATEESFGELANTYSADGGSNTNGGLYEDVHPGQMVTEFNDWCFDAARKAGDTAIVKTSYGYHVMYYVGATESYYWREVAEGELRYQEYDAKLSEIVSPYTTVPTDKLDILEPDAVTAIQSQATGTEVPAVG